MKIHAKMITQTIFYGFTGVLLALTVYAYASSLFRAITGRGEYIIEVSMSGKDLDQKPTPALALMLQSRIRQIHTDLNETKSESNRSDGNTLPYTSLDGASNFGTLHPGLLNFENFSPSEEFKASVGGVDVGSMWSWVHRKLVSSKTISFKVFDEPNQVCITADVSAVFPEHPWIWLELSKLNNITGLPVADSISSTDITEVLAFELLRIQYFEAGLKRLSSVLDPVERKRVGEKLKWSSVYDFRQDVTAYTTQVRARRNAHLRAAKLEIESHMLFAKHNLDPLFGMTKGRSLPELKLLSDDSRYVYMQAPNFYFAPPSVRLLPDKTFGNIALLYIVGANSQAWDWQTVSGSVLESYCDILAVTLKQRLRKQNSTSASWVLAEKGLDWSLGNNPSVVKEGKPLQSLSNPGEAHDNDFQVSNMKDYVHGNDVVNGIHRNSGILNIAFYHMAQSMGTDEALKIWLSALPKLSNPAEFIDLADKIRKSAGEKEAQVDDALKKAGL